MRVCPCVCACVCECVCVGLFPSAGYTEFSEASAHHVFKQAALIMLLLKLHWNDTHIAHYVATLECALIFKHFDSVYTRLLYAILCIT